MALTESVRSFQVPATPGTTAWPPSRWMRLTNSGPILPVSTIFTTSMVAPSVTRNPLTNLGSMPRRFCHEEISGPPPWTSTGRMPTKRSSTTSWRKASTSSPIAAPPSLITRVWPEKRRM